MNELATAAALAVISLQVIRPCIHVGFSKQMRVKDVAKARLMDLKVAFGVLQVGSTPEGNDQTVVSPSY